MQIRSNISSGANVQEAVQSPLALVLPCLLSLTAAAAAERAPIVPPSPEPFVATLKVSFAVWDRDHDGTLAVAELDAALADYTIKGDAAAALATVKRLSRGKTTAGIPRTLDSLIATAQQPLQPKDKEAPNLPAKFADAQKRIANAKRDLFAVAVPALETLHQGAMGNCFSLAPLGSMLSRNPAQVKAMFQQGSDGTYQVVLGKKAVTVPAPTDAEIAISSSNEATGLWSNVYEKAAGAARNELRADKEKVGTPLDAIAKGGSAGTMLAFITGHEMVRFTLTWAKDPKTTPEAAEAKLKELRAKLNAAFAEHRCVTTGTTTPKMAGLRGGHAYGVIGYNDATDEIRIWDPHGDSFKPKGEPSAATGFPRKDGICDMPLTVFVKQFAGLAFEILPPQSTPTQVSAR